MKSPIFPALFAAMLVLVIIAIAFIEYRFFPPALGSARETKASRLKSGGLFFFMIGGIAFAREYTQDHFPGSSGILKHAFVPAIVGAICGLVYLGIIYLVKKIRDKP